MIKLTLAKATKTCKAASDAFNAALSPPAHLSPDKADDLFLGLFSLKIAARANLVRAYEDATPEEIRAHWAELVKR